MISSVLVSFSESLLPLSHWTKCFNSLLMTDSIVPSSLLENIRLISSAKWWMIDFQNAYCRSLIYRRNNKGPRVDSWGTPHVIVFMLEETPCRESYCLRFLRKELNQLLANPRYYNTQVSQVGYCSLQCETAFEG